MDSLDNLLSPRISWILAPDEADAERVEWPLNKDTSIPDKNTSFIHLDTADT